MRILLLSGFLVFFVAALVAQTAPRSNVQPTRPTTTTKAQPDAAGKTATPPAVTPRTTTAPARPAGDDPAATNRTGLTPKSPATPKTLPAKMPDAPQPKQEPSDVQVQWMTVEEALEKSKTEKRKIFVDVFTDWCGWCKRMDETTFSDPAVAQYLNANYYPVKFNAEQQEDIVFNNKTYSFRKNGARGYHELAAELLNSRLSFPTVVFMDESLHVIQPIPGYLEALKLEAILNYFGTDSHKTTPWETYERKFSNNQR